MKQKRTYQLRGSSLVLLTGAVLQVNSIMVAYHDRGRFAIGGEWFVLPVALLVYAGLKEFYRGLEKTHSQYMNLSVEDKKEIKKMIIIDVLQAFSIFTMLAIFSILSML